MQFLRIAVLLPKSVAYAITIKVCASGEDEVHLGQEGEI